MRLSAWAAVRTQHLSLLPRSNSLRSSRRFGEGGSGSAFSGRRAFSTSAASSKGEELKQRVKTFIDEKVMPIETEVLSQGYNGGDDEWKEHPLLDGVKEEAKKAGLWNLFLPAISGCSNLEYA